MYPPSSFIGGTTETLSWVGFPSSTIDIRLRADADSVTHNALLRAHQEIVSLLLDPRRALVTHTRADPGGRAIVSTPNVRMNDTLWTRYSYHPTQSGNAPVFILYARRVPGDGMSSRSELLYQVIDLAQPSSYVVYLNSRRLDKTPWTIPDTPSQVRLSYPMVQQMAGAVYHDYTNLEPWPAGDVIYESSNILDVVANNGMRSASYLLILLTTLTLFRHLPRLHQR